jgi:hypothetical protein
LAENKCYGFISIFAGTASALGTLADTTQRHTTPKKTTNFHQQKNKTSRIQAQLAGARRQQHLQAELEYFIYQHF